MKVVNQQVFLPILKQKNISLFIKREDKLHPLISGNKYRKLKYNLIAAKANGSKCILTFGGAYSNHIAATACAGKEYGFKTIGVIRGEELRDKWRNNPTLKLAHKHGMEFLFVSREKYREKECPSFLKSLQHDFGVFYLLPEGGTNELAIKGCEEILTDADKEFDVVCCSVGTGGTLSGIINSSRAEQQVLGFSALKGDFIREDICKFVAKENWELVNGYHFGGYARVNKELVHFINEFKEKSQIPLDPIYTGKMLFGILDRVQKGHFKENTRILAIHTGGLQGIAGINLTLGSKGLPMIHV
ncbi:1-aminocyclopropane-1-carboxylate deaminase [Saonia flava]|uniref:1-aminocyclopropane-1-carboxylate deaminase n=1 Tax=Saonia flava TaxID=523696 RepID=A0A846R7Z5_9FLAO|nr:pyridoxal-phosphate dependent enzyme [Saonia flava]NJB72869.1 1-aminocyclopropane-1-carboxylate deaminase [Saonia flava]